MTREFKEETGLETYWYDWWPVVTLLATNNTYEVTVYKCWKNSLEKLETMTDEKIEIIDVADVHNQKILSPWLLMMCLDKRVSSGLIKLKQ